MPFFPRQEICDYKSTKRVVTSPWRPVASALALKALVMYKCNLDLTLWHHIKIAAFRIDYVLKIMLIL